MEGTCARTRIYDRNNKRVLAPKRPRVVSDEATSTTTTATSQRVVKKRRVAACNNVFAGIPAPRSPPFKVYIDPPSPPQKENKRPASLPAPSSSAAPSAVFRPKTKGGSSKRKIICLR